ncbi:MAG: ribulose-phosphate 3-epimerase [Firmicutes bacterium]|nr:ribulose-phosphate 3-epimerase [Bacillota bacterium]MCL1953476.1 ribulose-phosphate 3-epimerase [Bacillota bacterium]
MNTENINIQQKTPLIAPSILSADFSNLKETVIKLQESGADILHFDVMDGIFVPHLSFGPKLVADLRKYITIPLAVHLMVGRPERITAAIAEAGADMISFHIESTDREYVVPMLRDIKRRKLKAGLAISPDTSIKVLTNCLDSLDYIILMSVYPGSSGQQLLEKTYDRLTQLKALIGDRDIKIEIDGGITLDNVAQIKAIGVDTIISGNCILGSTDWKQAMIDLREKQLEEYIDIDDE